MASKCLGNFNHALSHRSWLIVLWKKGCGKETLLSSFVWVLCKRQPKHLALWGVWSCQWLKADTHPPCVHTTDEEIRNKMPRSKLRSTRDLLPFVQQTVDGWRVIIIEPAEALNTASANALLENAWRTWIVCCYHFIGRSLFKNCLQPFAVVCKHFALDRIKWNSASSNFKSAFVP